MVNDYVTLDIDLRLLHNGKYRGKISELVTTFDDSDDIDCRDY